MVRVRRTPAAKCQVRGRCAGPGETPREQVKIQGKVRSSERNKSPKLPGKDLRSRCLKFTSSVHGCWVIVLRPHSKEPATWVSKAPIGAFWTILGRSLMLGVLHALRNGSVANLGHGFWSRISLKAWICLDAGFWLHQLHLAA